MSVRAVQVWLLALAVAAVPAADDPVALCRALADEAADLYFRELPIEASGVTCLFGLADESQRTRFELVARRMSARAAEAEVAVDEAILALETQPGFETDPGTRAERRRLADQERDRRIPFLRGVGAALYAHLENIEPQERMRSARLASDTLVPLIGLLEPQLAQHAALHAALARIILGEYETARALLAGVVAEERAAAMDRLAAALALVRITATQSGPEAALRQLEEQVTPRVRAGDALAAVLVADNRFALRNQNAGQTQGTERIERLGEACMAYLELLDADLGLDPGAQRALVMQRLRLAVPADAPLGSLPPIVTVARALGLATVPARRAESVALLERLLERRGVGETVRAEALLALGTTLLADDRLAEATDRLGQLVAEQPHAPQARAAAELAVQCAGALYEADPSDRAATARYRDALERLLGEFADGSDLDEWRCAAADLAVTEGRTADAQDLYDAVAVGGAWGSRAAAGQVFAIEAMAEAEPDPMKRETTYRDLLERSASLRQGLERSARQGDPTAASSLRRIHLAEASAMVAIQRPRDALRHLDQLDARTLGDLADEALVIRIEALSRLGDPIAIAEHLETFLESAGDDAGQTLRTMLESRGRAIDRLQAAGLDTEALESVRETVLPVADALDQWLSQRTGKNRDPALVLAAADAYRLARRCDRAGLLYAEVLRDQPALLGGLIGRAECLVAARTDYAAAMAIYRRIAEALDERSGDDYWLAQLRMLQILDETHHHPERIAPHIRQLRERDPALGGERFRHAFDALERKYS